MPINDLIIIRKGTASEWISANPILASGEPGFDISNKILKIGDGVSNWISLGAISGAGGSGGGGGLLNLVEDTSPQLGGGLDLNSYNITGSGNININGNIYADHIYSDLSGTIVYANSGNINILTSATGLFSGSLKLNNLDVSTVGHTHISSNITDFNSSVSGLVSGVYAPLSGKLNQFASTTSAELSSVISDQTGSGILVFNTNPVFSGSITAQTGNFTTNLQVGSTSLTTNDVLNIINSTNLYLWSNFR